MTTMGREGGTGSAEDRGGRHRGNGARDATVLDSEKELFRKTPWPFPVIIFLIETAAIFYLNGAFRHFQKLGKYSCKLPRLVRNPTKIGGSK